VLVIFSNLQLNITIFTRYRLLDTSGEKVPRLST